VAAKAIAATVTPDDNAERGYVTPPRTPYISSTINSTPHKLGSSLSESEDKASPRVSSLIHLYATHGYSPRGHPECCSQSLHGSTQVGTSSADSQPDSQAASQTGGRGGGGGGGGAHAGGTARGVSPPERRDERRLREAFETADTDANGALSKRELYGALASVGLSLTSAQQLAIWRTQDHNDDGRVTFREFRQLGLELFERQANGLPLALGPTLSPMLGPGSGFAPSRAPRRTTTAPQPPRSRHTMYSPPIKSHRRHL